MLKQSLEVSESWLDHVATLGYLYTGQPIQMDVKSIYRFYILFMKYVYIFNLLRTIQVIGTFLEG